MASGLLRKRNGCALGCRWVVVIPRRSDLMAVTFNTNQSEPLYGTVARDVVSGVHTTSSTPEHHISDAKQLCIHCCWRGSSIFPPFIMFRSNDRMQVPRFRITEWPRVVCLWISKFMELTHQDDGITVAP
jgi:hypothetical protein